MNGAKSKMAKKPKRNRGLNIIRLPELCEKIGMSKPSVYRMMKQGDFPNSIQISGVRSVGWVESEVDNWIESRMQA